MAGLDVIRQKMAEFLRQQGIAAVTAWGGTARKQQTGVVAAVALKSCEGGPAGFRDYLGEQFNAAAGKWEELYGKRVKLVFGLDLYAERGGEAALGAAFNTLADGLKSQGPEGLRMTELSCGETEYDEKMGRYHCPVEAVCQAYLYAVADEGGAFLDFEVRGEQKK